MELSESTLSPTLSPEERSVLLEEEEIAARARTEILLAARPDPRARDEAADILSRIRTLRDEAATARTDDLSALFDQMHTLRALMGRVQQKGSPDLDAPYFAHLKVSEAGRTRDYLLGRITFISNSADVRIVDWRHAPIARLFYLYREGDDYEEQLPGRVARGTILARRVLAFREGRLETIITPEFTLQRRQGVWTSSSAEDRPILAGGEQSAVRGAPDITALLDKEQYAALEAHGSEPLLIVGGAGSGKTTVALHRSAALVYKDKNRFRPSKMRAIVPEEGLARLTERLLRWLGVPGIKAETFSRFARAEVIRLAPRLPRRICQDTPTAVARLKHHPALLRALPEWVARHPRRKLDLAADRAELFTDRAFLEEIVRQAKGEIPAGTALETARHTLRQLSRPTEEEYADVEEERRTALDGLPLDAGTSDDVHQTIDEEDDAVLLEIARLRAGKDENPLPDCDHLVLDEAQEFSAIELSVLGSLCQKRRSVTIAGDEAQRLDPLAGLDSWQKRLEHLGVPEAAVQELRISYRSSRYIAKFAHDVLGPLAPKELPAARRQGAPVERFLFSSEGELALFLLDTLQDLLLREPDASIAVLTRLSEAAERIAGFLKHLPEARLVKNGAFSFLPGVDVAEVSAAKGLEFDYVIIPDADGIVYPETPESRRTLHVAATRAIHQLWVLAVRRFSPVLPAPEEETS